MSPSSNIPPRPSEAEWEGHKETIRILYLLKDKQLLGPEGVQEEMKLRYSFQAEYVPDLLTCLDNKSDHFSPYEYEKHFKAWNFRKNLKGAEWRQLRRKILARKREGKESDVYLEGVLLPAKKVKRALGRYLKKDTAVESVIQEIGKLRPRYLHSQF
jgi:hypothetical protein